jgi:hypothetical protein
MICYYCGSLNGDTLDHIIPYSFYSLHHKRIKSSSYNDPVPVVPACRECNSTLHNILYIDIRDRADILKERYLKKYAKILKTPHWDKKDILKLGKTLRAVIIKDTFIKKDILERLDYLEMIANLAEDPFLEEKKALGWM